MIVTCSSAKRGFVSTCYGILWDPSYHLEWPSKKVLDRSLFVVDIFVDSRIQIACPGEFGSEWPLCVIIPNAQKDQIPFWITHIQSDSIHHWNSQNF